MTHTEKLQHILDELDLEWDAETAERLLAMPPRYVEVGVDGSLGALYAHGTADAVASSLLMGITEPWAFGGYYDLDEEQPQALGALFRVTLKDKTTDVLCVPDVETITWPEEPACAAPTAKPS